MLSQLEMTDIKKSSRGRRGGEGRWSPPTNHFPLGYGSNGEDKGLFVSWLLNVPATCQCISGTDLLRHFTCCHTEIEVADPTFHLTQSQYADTGPTSPSTDPGRVATGVPIVKALVYDSTPDEKSRLQRDSSPGSSALEADALTTRPTRRSWGKIREREWGLR